MISKILYLLEKGLGYVQLHPKYLLVIALAVFSPLFFLYVSSSFMEAGESYQDRLLRDRIGIINDVLEAQLSSKRTDAFEIQNVIVKIAEQSSDIEKLRVLVQNGRELVPIAALDLEVIGKPVPENEIKSYEESFSSVGGVGIIFPYVDSRGITKWQSFRGFLTSDGERVYVFSETSQENYQLALQEKNKNAYTLMAFAFALVFAIAFWVHKSADYEYLYKQSVKKLEEKDNFLNLMAHELRAPLTAMRGYASLIAESSEVKQEHKEHAIRIQKSTERLVNIINDVLEVARIQSGTLSISFNAFNLVEEAQNVIDELQSSAAKKDIDLYLKTSSSSVVVTSDAKRLHQVLVNIVSNSIKYTEEGSIEVELIDGYKQAEIRVRDTGVGIHAEDQKKLFSPFFRVQNDSTENITGTGLGMWITKELTQMFGGSIGIESMRGVGTIVVITVPKKKKKQV